MKKNLLLIALVFSIKSYSQLSTTFANPGVDSAVITNITDIKIDEYRLPLGGTYRLKIPLSNSSNTGEVPLGSCKIKIGLGSKMVLSPFFDLLSSATSQYFIWTAGLTSGQIQIEGELKKPLPANYFDTLSFDVVGSLAGVSTTTVNFLITNHNTTTILSDEDPTNNYSFLSYQIIVPDGGPVPVTFTSLSATKNNCTVSILFDAEREINTKKYEVECSKDGILFNKLGEINANNSIHYSYNFDINSSIANKYLYYRIKSLDLDGRFQYSQTKVIDGLCSALLSIKVFPNPVNDQASISIRANSGLFNGKYKVYLYDATGKLMNSNNYQFLNTSGFDFPLTKIAGGQYLLKIVNQADTAETFSVMIQKN